MLTIPFKTFLVSTTPNYACNICGYLTIGEHKRDDIFYAHKSEKCRCGRQCFRIFIQKDHEDLAKTPVNYSCSQDPVIRERYAQYLKDVGAGFILEETEPEVVKVKQKKQLQPTLDDKVFDPTTAKVFSKKLVLRNIPI